MEDVQTARLVARSAGMVSPLAHKPKLRPEGAANTSLLCVPIPRETQRSSNQRAEDRLMGLVDAAKLHYCDEDHEVEVVNLSSGGAMLKAPLLPRIGERVELEFSDGRRFRCSVRWVKDGRIGLEFVDDALLLGRQDAQQLVMTLARARDGRLADGDVRDRPRRHGLIRAGSIQIGGREAPVRLKNISKQGAMIEGECDLTPGSEVRLDLSGLGYVVAEIRWAEDGHAGVKFEHEIDLEPIFARPEPQQSFSEIPPMLVPDYLKNESANSPWANRWATLSATELKPIEERG